MANFRERDERRERRETRDERELKLTLTLPGGVAAGVRQGWRNCELLFTDTDSFCYSIPQVENIYEIIKESDWFDFSNFPKDRKYYSEANKMILGN